MISILLWYAIEDAFESIDNSLEPILLKKANLSLMMSTLTSMSIVSSSRIVDLIFLYFLSHFLFSI